MSRPCGHTAENDHYAGLAGRPEGYCPVCWHYFHTPGYRELYDGLPVPDLTPPPPAPEPPSSPGLWRRVAHFGAAAAKHALDGFAHVTEEEYRRRLSVCAACPFWVNNVCTKCGCPVAGDKRVKARWRSETCPLGKWEEGTPLA